MHWMGITLEATIHNFSVEDMKYPFTDLFITHKVPLNIQVTKEIWLLCDNVYYLIPELLYF